MYGKGIETIEHGEIYYAGASGVGTYDEETRCTKWAGDNNTGAILRGKFSDIDMFYFRSDPKRTKHYIYYYPQNKMPYLAEDCDIPRGCEFKTAKELFEAKIYDGKSLKDRWWDSIVVYEGGISEYERKKHLFQTIERIETPFGDIHVWVNGKKIPFYVYTETCDDDESVRDKPVLVRKIRVPLTNMKKDDVVLCGINNIILSFEDTDDWETLFSCEDDETILGISTTEPSNESSFCYKAEGNISYGLGYRITADTGNFKDEKLYPYRVLSFATTWLNKADYEDVGGAHSVLSLALIY